MFKEKSIRIIQEYNVSPGKSLISYITTHEKLANEEKKLLEEVYQKASVFELWNFPNINTGRKNAIIFLKENYGLDQKTCEVIVNDISYNWL